jgi:hypothetical protein
MGKDTARAEALWELQDAYERLVLARAHVVHVLREVRSVVTERRNYDDGRQVPRVSRYASPEDVIAGLHRLSRLARLVQPGRQNRVKPEVLMRRFESAVAAVGELEERIGEMERELQEPQSQAAGYYQLKPVLPAGQNAALPRGTCPECGREVGIRQDGTFRFHRGRHRGTCPGSHQEAPGPVA